MDAIPCSVQFVPVIRAPTLLLHAAPPPLQLHAMTVGSSGFQVLWSMVADPKDLDDVVWASPLIGPNHSLYLETFQDHVILAFQGPGH